jgi:hypothetical protein
MRTPSQDDNAVQIGAAEQRQKRRRFAFGGTFEMPDDYALVMLLFTTLTGLAAIVAAMFTTMLPLPDFWRYFWLAVCIVSFGLCVVGIVLLFRWRQESQKKLDTSQKE